MAFKGPIDFNAEVGEVSDQIGAALGEGLQVLGVDSTAANFRDFSSLAVFVTVFTNKAVADAVLKKALRHTPYDRGELFDSGYSAPTDGSPHMGYSNPTVIEENVEGTARAYAKGILVSGSFTARSGFFAGRTFSKYAVGFTAPHAAWVHENLAGQAWRQDTRSPFADVKTDHFLLYAYEAYAPRYSSAMRQAMAEVERKIAEVAEKRKPSALGGPLGKPRLVKR